MLDLVYVPTSAALTIELNVDGDLEKSRSQGFVTRTGQIMEPNDQNITNEGKPSNSSQCNMIPEVSFKLFRVKGRERIRLIRLVWYSTGTSEFKFLTT